MMIEYACACCNKITPFLKGAAYKNEKGEICLDFLCYECYKKHFPDEKVEEPKIKIRII
jgi:hypothetical protein